MEALGAGLAALAVIGPGLAIGILTGMSTSAMGRNPEVSGNIQINMFIGIAFTEAISIYALVVSLILIFVAK